MFACLNDVIILELRVVTTCWSWAWTNRTSPSNGVGLGSPLATYSVYGDLTSSIHTVNNLCLFNCQWHAYLCNWGPYVRLAYMLNMLSSWNKVVIIIIIIIMTLFKAMMDSLRQQFYPRMKQAGRDISDSHRKGYSCPMCENGLSQMMY